MLSKSNRLSSPEVRAVLKNGRTLRTPNLVVKYIRGEKSKIAVVVSKKIARSAVKRNAIRRAVYRVLSHSLPPRNSAVLLVQKDTSDFSPDIKTLCSKLSS
jgi:ribonuclease P protein component